MFRSLLKKFIRLTLKKIRYLTSLHNIINFQNEISQIKKSHKIIALVMCNPGQQQFFEDIYRLSLKNKKKYYFFLVNDFDVKEAEKTDLFRPLKLITPSIYQYINGVDLALHTEIHCRSWNVKDVCFIGHGFPGKHTEYSVKNLNSFNHYFLYGPRDRDILNFVTKDNPDCVKQIKFHEVGYPRYDSQINNTFKAEALEKELGLDQSLKTILFAPAWDPGGALRKYGVELFDKFGKMRGYNVIIKLHPASTVSKRSKDYMFYTGGVNWMQVLNGIGEKYENIYVYWQQKINHLFKISDVLVTDFSGVTMGFFLEDKPVVNIDCPEFYETTLPSLGSDGELSRSNNLFNNGRNASHLVINIDSLEEMINHTLANPGEMSEMRKKYVSDLLYNPGKGTKHALAAIDQILEREQV
jgi:hypothetical protein